MKFTKLLALTAIATATLTSATIASASDNVLVTKQNILTSKYFVNSSNIANVDIDQSELKSFGLVTNQNVLTSQHFVANQQQTSNGQIAAVTFDSVNDSIVTDQNILTSQYVVDTYQSLN